MARRSCWYEGRNYGAGQEHDGGTAAASCETWRHYGAAGTEDGTTELDRNTRVVLLLEAGTAAASCETWRHYGAAVGTLLVGWRKACLVVHIRSRR